MLSFSPTSEYIFDVSSVCWSSMPLRNLTSNSKQLILFFEDSPNFASSIYLGPLDCRLGYKDVVSSFLKSIFHYLLLFFILITDHLLHNSVRLLINYFFCASTLTITMFDQIFHSSYFQKLRYLWMYILVLVSLYDVNHRFH